MVKDAEFEKLGNPTRGTEFEINDHRGVIIGIAKVTSSGLFGVPTLYTTYKSDPVYTLHEIYCLFYYGRT
jgi:putative ABC transport system permease protein